MLDCEETKILCDWVSFHKETHETKKIICMVIRTNLPENRVILYYWPNFTIFLSLYMCTGNSLGWEMAACLEHGFIPTVSEEETIVGMAAALRAHEPQQNDISNNNSSEGDGLK